MPSRAAGGTTRCRTLCCFGFTPRRVRVVVALTLADLDTTNSQVALHEKGGTLRWQPVSPTLLAALRQYASARGAQNPSDQVFRYLVRKGDTVGAPLTRHRYNTLANRWQKALPWAAQYAVSPHWLRHTTVTAAERLSGSFGVASAFAGHAVPDDAPTTSHPSAFPRRSASGYACPLSVSEARGSAARPSKR